MSSGSGEVLVAVPVTVTAPPSHWRAGLHTSVRVAAGSGMQFTLQLAVAAGLESPHSLCPVADPLNVWSGHCVSVVFTVSVAVPLGATFGNVCDVPATVIVMSSSLCEVFVAVPVTATEPPSHW